MASSATQKGNRGQSLAIKLIKKWTGKKFKSTSQSGMPGYNHDPHMGDVRCITEGHIFPFCVEVKFYKDINFCQLLQPNLKNVTILEFWAQCFGDANHTKKVPMLMMRFNGLPRNFFFLVITENFWDKIGYKMTSQVSKVLTLYDKKLIDNLVIIGSTEFFKLPYKEIKEIAKAHKKSLYGKK